MLSRSVMPGSFATPWTAAHQGALHMGFSGQEYWGQFSCPPPRQQEETTKQRLGSIYTICYWKDLSSVKHSPSKRRQGTQRCKWEGRSDIRIYCLQSSFQERSQGGREYGECLWVGDSG